MTTTITAVFDSKPEAERAQASLAGHGIGRDKVDLVHGTSPGLPGSGADADAYNEALRRGGTVLLARVDALEAARLGDRAELLRAVAEARIPDEALAGIVLRLDAARMQIRDAGASTERMSAEAVALLLSLHPKADDLGIQVSALHAKADQAGLDRAALLARTDTLVRRHVIPAGPDVAVRTDDRSIEQNVVDPGRLTARRPSQRRRRWARTATRVGPA